MEKVISIFLSGKNYKLTESAYRLMTEYDRFIHKKYKDPEFHADVETQMSAILDTDMDYPEKVLERADVEEAIKLIGKNENIKFYAGSYSTNTSSKIMRNTEKGLIGGVSAGFADYLNIDPIIVRALFIALAIFFGPGLLIYLGLWIVLPAMKKEGSFIKNSNKK